MKTSIVPLRTATFVALAMATLLALDGPFVLAQRGNSAPPKSEKWDYGPLASVPEKARAKHNPLENDPDAPIAGGKLFEEHCAECHGKKAEGGKKGPSLLHEEVQQATPGAIFWILTNGVVRHGMPVWSKLPEPQRWQIVTFLKSLRASGVAQSSAVPR